MIADDVEALTVAAAPGRGAPRRCLGADAERQLRAKKSTASPPPDCSPSPCPSSTAGGASATLAEVFRLLASADASLAQIPQNHFVYVNVLRRQGTPEQQTFFFDEVLAGRRFGNAQSEAGTRHVQDIRTRLDPGLTARTSSA